METGIAWNTVPWNRYLDRTGDIDTGQGSSPGWVVSHEGALLEIVTPSGRRRAEVSGKLRYMAELGTSELPAVGDFVILRAAAEDGQNAQAVSQIDSVLPRWTTFRRKEAGDRTEAQIICSNADVAIIMTTAPAVAAQGGNAAGHDLDDFSVRRIERYMATLDRQIRPIVVLNKCDLVSDREAVRSHVAAELPGATVIALSALTGDGVEELAGCLEAAEVAVIVGSSGCGKTTLIAGLTGLSLETGVVRQSDGRGRHTTTNRTVHLLPGGALLVDTPGMREVQLWSDDDADPVAAAFPEITALQGQCRFRDCRHEHEPGCAVKASLEAGEILPERYQSYLQLRDEAEMTAERRREITRERGRQIARYVRQIKKERNR